MKIMETNLAFNANHNTRSGNPDGIVLHHAASGGSVQDVHNYHLSLGWAGIGYHFYVRKDGSVYRGRPEEWIGSHTSGHNSKIGICAEGNFETDIMSTAQKNAIIELLEHLRSKYGNLPVYGHRDLDATACPGKNYPFHDIVNGKKEIKTLYRVQVGAFTEKQNAENMVDYLDKLGVAGHIVEGGTGD